MKAIYVIPLLFVVISCGSIKMLPVGDSSFNKESCITVFPLKDDDLSGSEEELKYLLIANGYNYVPYYATSNYSYSGETIYCINLSATYYNDTYLGHRYSNFAAEIDDLRTKEIVMTVHFRGDRSCRSILKNFVKKMNKILD